MFQKLDDILVSGLHRWALPVLRVSLAIVFLWFGLLKLFGVSPVVELIQTSFSFMPYPAFITILGVWEVLIGLGLLFKIAPRVTLPLLWLQMLGTFGSLVLNPGLFFSGNVFLLTTEGEFVVKNLVLVAASLVIGSHDIKPRFQ